MNFTNIKDINFLIMKYKTQLKYNDVLESLNNEFKMALKYSNRRKDLKGMSYYHIIQNLRVNELFGGCMYINNTTYIKTYKIIPKFKILKKVAIRNCFICGFIIRFPFEFFQYNQNSDFSYYNIYLDKIFCKKCQIFIRTNII